MAPRCFVMRRNSLTFSLPLEWIGHPVDCFERFRPCQKIKAVFDGTTVQLKLGGHFPEQMVDFIAAYWADLDSDSRAEASGRCLIVSGAEAWNALVSQRERLILVADSNLDLCGEFGSRLIQKARRSGHAVIFSGPQGGIPDPTSAPLRAPRSHQVKGALEKSGYTEERARVLAQKSNGNLGSLLRCLQNLSLMPEWSEGSAAAELTIASLLGEWSEPSDADRSVVETLSGKEYGEWIGLIREISSRPGTPLSHRDGSWKFIARYEGWNALGSRVFDDQLDRIQIVAIAVLQEVNPQFELPPEKRNIFPLRGKSLSHSNSIRNGLAECLALLGSHPKALTSCTLGKANITADLSVRAILNGADWQRWASLNELLPLLAEAAPSEFLDAIENALTSTPCPFDEVFAQEGDGIMGSNYMSGLLWSLETLAWDADLLTRVLICLGELAARDPGGRGGNRPAHTMTTILLPWFSQTCAPVPRRVSALASLLEEVPEVGWKLLLTLLPQSHSISSGSRKPAWREIIPEDWPKDVTRREYREQITLYAELAINTAKSSPGKLAELIDHMENLPPPVYDQLLAHLASPAVVGLPEYQRISLWTEITDLVMKHRKYSDSDWAMGHELVEELASLADKLKPSSPSFQFKRLFSARDFELYEEKGNYEEQQHELLMRRKNAIEEVATEGGSQAVMTFASQVQAPRLVGISYGLVAPSSVDEVLFPEKLDSDMESLRAFAGGFVWSRFYVQGWSWVDAVDMSSWTPKQIGLLLSNLPFTPATWERSTRLLGQDENAYWTITSANPYEAEGDLYLAIDRLLDFGRPNAAIRCLHKLLNDNKSILASSTVRALLAAVESAENIQSTEVYEIVELIKALQNDAMTNPEDLFRVEWAYLALLDQHQGASPKYLNQRLANEPGFFCEVIRLVFRSKNEDSPKVEADDGAKNVASNAYRLLREWRTPPGSRKDGTFDGEALMTWLEAVRTVCVETGHIEVAMLTVGHVLIHAPADPSGLWIHRTAAGALNEKCANDMRDGYRTELFNSRGVHWVDPSGHSEKELAAKYRAQAEAIEGAGFFRLANTLRDLAESYEREAERVVREHFDD